MGVLVEHRGDAQSVDRDAHRVDVDPVADADPVPGRIGGERVGHRDLSVGRKPDRVRPPVCRW